ncbi:MAG: hypothetical protein HY471_02060 [Candidatus Sungbacteria bacterium]|nr:hypothetical protein [Candidatus Sungbacteria bacterium]
MSDAVNTAFQRLLDELTSWERNTGRQSLLVLIPALPDERVVLSDSGKPWKPLSETESEEVGNWEAADRIILAFQERARNRR